MNQDISWEAQTSMPVDSEIVSLSDDDNKSAPGPAVAAAATASESAPLPKAAKSKAKTKSSPESASSKKPDPTAKPKAKGKSKAKATTKKPAKTEATEPGEPRHGSSGEPAASEPAASEAPVVAKRPSAKMKRPAAAVDRMPDKRTAKKYCYHKDQKWGIALSGPGGGEFCTAGYLFFVFVSPL